MSNPLPSHLAKLERLAPGRRDLVEERACLIYFGCPGTSWADADTMALEQEGAAQRGLPGVGR